MTAGKLTFIRHITLTTGDSRDSYRSEIGPDIIARFEPIMLHLEHGRNGTTPVPGIDGYSIGGRTSGGCLVATVWANGPPAEIVCTIGIALHSRCGATLWKALHRWGEAPVRTDPTQCPPEPWCAAALYTGIVRHVDAADWLGDFERCLAWAWYARRNP